MQSDMLFAEKLFWYLLVPIDFRVSFKLTRGDDDDDDDDDDDCRDADKRAALAAKAKEKDELEKKEHVRTNQKDETATITTLEVDTSRTDKKKAETEISIPSLPKAPSLQSHPHIFKDRKKVDRVVKKPLIFP